MKFECGDLERALANPDLMPEAREHTKTCAACRQQLRLWTEISNSARELHQDWDTPQLWPRILQNLQAEQQARKTNHWQDWRLWSAVAAALLITVGSLFMWRRPLEPAPIAKTHVPAVATTADQDFLTEQALIEVEKTEAAYRKSIDQLAHLAEPKLENTASADSVNTREKLLMLDGAIADTRSNVASNRFNLHLQNTLADLYREKQKTLKDLLTSEQKN